MKIADPVDEIRDLLSHELREERLARLSPASRDLYERMMARREAIGQVDFDLTATLRELRQSG